METLPDELVYFLLSFVGCRDLLAMACVNKQLNRIATDPSLHRIADFSGCWHVNSKYITSYIIRFSGCVERLNLEDCYQLDQWVLMQIIPGCKALKCLNILGCRFPIQALKTVLQNCKHLQHLCWSVPYEFLSEIEDGSKVVCLPQLGKLKSLYLRLPTSSDQAFEKIDIFLASWRPFLFNLQRLKIIQVERFCVTLSRTLLELVNISRLHVKLSSEHEDFDFQITQRTPFENIPRFLDTVKNWTQRSLFNRCLESFYITSFFYPAGVWDWILSLSSEIVKGLSHLTEADFTGKTAVAAVIYAMNHPTSLLKCLRYINLSFSYNVTGNFLKVLAETSPTIVSINLYGCAKCLEPIDGIKEVAEKCIMLKELSLGGICCHGDPVPPLLTMLSNLMSQLTSLTLPSCCCPEAGVGNTLNHFSKCQRAVKEFELMDLKIRTPMARTYTKAQFIDSASSRHHINCTQLIQDDCLAAISSWSQLKRLTLAGVETPGHNLDFLEEITQNCPELEFLSLAHLSSLCYHGASETLNKALAKCYRLRQLRFEQTYFDVTESFFASLHNATILEGICVICKSGSIAFSGLVPLLDKCSRLAVVQVFGDSPAPLDTFRNMTTILKKRYEGLRPGFSVCLLPYDSNTTDIFYRIFDQTDEIPFIHFTRLTTFGSSVAIQD